MRTIVFFFFALSFLTIISCKGQPPLTGIGPKGIPYSTTDTLEALEGAQSVQNGAMTRWRDRVANSRASTTREAYGSGPCIRPNAGFPDTSVAREFMSKSRRYRESLGGPGCQCIPLGDLCGANICNCSEICPNDHGIFQSQAGQMMPTDQNNLAFTNMIGSTGPWQTYHNTEGFCSGMQMQRRKFAALARFKPNLFSWPAMRIPSTEYVDFTKREIDRMLQGSDPHFLGAKNLTELRQKDPEIDRYFRQKTGELALGSGAGDSVNRHGMTYTPRNSYGPEVHLNFLEQSATNLSAKVEQDTDIDPATGAAYGPIPPAGTSAFEQYMAKKVERVASGYPAVLPGYPNLQTLSGHPVYQEVIGRYSAIDWQQVNGLDSVYADGAPPFYSDDWATRAYQPMNTSEADSFLEQLEDRLPSYSSSGSGPGTWNSNGPWQTVSLKLRGSLNPALGTGSGNDTYNHAVEAYALEHRSNGEIYVCIGDPNLYLNSNHNTDCNNHITIPPKGPDNLRGELTYNSIQFIPHKLGQVGISPSSDRYQGAMTQRMVEYCRTVNRSRFNVNDCN